MKVVLNLSKAGYLYIDKEIAEAVLEKRSDGKTDVSALVNSKTILLFPVSLDNDMKTVLKSLEIIKKDIELRIETEEEEIILEFEEEETAILVKEDRLTFVRKSDGKIRSAKFKMIKELLKTNSKELVTKKLLNDLRNAGYVIELEKLEIVMKPL